MWNKPQFFELQYRSSEGNIVKRKFFANSKTANEEYDKALAAGWGVRLITIKGHCLCVERTNRQPLKTLEEAKKELKKKEVK